MEGKDVLIIIALMLGPVIVAVFTYGAPCTVGPPKDGALLGGSGCSCLRLQRGSTLSVA